MDVCFAELSVSEFSRQLHPPDPLPFEPVDHSASAQGPRLADLWIEPQLLVITVAMLHSLS